MEAIFMPAKDGYNGGVRERTKGWTHSGDRTRLRT